MSIPIVDDFVFDDANEAEMARHGLTPYRVLQVLDEFIIVPNRRERRGAYLVIGRDHGGAFITIPIEPTEEPNIWRPITAWHSKKSEIARLGLR